MLDAAVLNQEEIERIRERFIRMKNIGELERKLKQLNRKQKKAFTTSGPHPHHLVEQQPPQPIRQVTHIGARPPSQQQQYYEQSTRGGMGVRGSVQ